MYSSIQHKIIAKIQHYCTFQERSHSEVRENLYGSGLYKSQVETIITQLIEDNYLNEERFALSFARGKFRIKNWGRIKIKYELQQRKVSTYNIAKALDEIDETEYNKVLQKLAEKKWKLVKANHITVKKFKTIQFLVQRGFEKHLAKASVDKAATIEKQAKTIL